MMIDEQHINFTTIGDLKRAIKDMNDDYVVVESYTDAIDDRTLMGSHTEHFYTNITARREVQTSSNDRLSGKLVW